VILLPNTAAVRKDIHFEGPPDVVVEIRSPEDESLDELPFYARLGVPEVWIIDRDSKVPTIYSLSGGDYESRTADQESWIRSEVTGIELRPRKTEGPEAREKLSIRLANDDSTRQDLPTS